jgi:MFS family permease
MTSTSGDRTAPALRRLVAVILLGGMLGILNSTMVAAGVDVLAHTFHASLSAVGWVSSGFLLAVTVTIPVTGWAVTRYGGKRLWLLGLGLFVLAALACGLAWNLPSLIAFRVVQGVAAGVLDPLVLTLLARAAGPGRVGRVMGLMAAVLSLGPVLGPVLGGAVLAGLGWRWLLWVSVPIGVAAAALAYRIMPTDPPAGSAGVPSTGTAVDPPAGPTAGLARTRLDVLGVALLGPGLAGVLLALTGGADRMGWGALAPRGAGLVLLAAYGAHAARRPAAALIDLRLFTRGGFTAGVAVMALTGVAMYASLFAVPLYLQQVRGYGTLAAGLLVAPLGIGAAIAAPLAGRLSDRLGSRNLALAGALIAAASALALTRTGAHTAVAWLVAGAVAIGAGLGFVGPPAMGSLYRTLPAELIPQGSSVLYMLNQLGAALGIAATALTVQTATGPLAGTRHVYWLVAAACTVVAGTAALLPGRPAAADQPADLPAGAQEVSR